MNRFAYIIAEGVLDVVFLAQMLKASGYKEIRKIADLPESAQKWLGRFKWPVDGDIARKAVPAPVFLQRDGAVVTLRNAEGLEKIEKTLDADMEAFLRLEWKPTSLAIILDADDKPPVDRFADFIPLIRKSEYPEPPKLDSVGESNELRSGIFSFPGKGKSGTLENVLVPLAERRFPELTKHALHYVDSWSTRNDLKTDKDFKELLKPSGNNKALLSATAALLKPAKPLRASIEDQGWLPDDLASCDALRPILAFLAQLGVCQDR